MSFIASPIDKVPHLEERLYEPDLTG